MIEAALRFLSAQLNAQLQPAHAAAPAVALARLVDDSGASALPTDGVGLALLAIEESRHLSAAPARAPSLPPPPPSLELTIIVAARDEDYGLALRRVSAAIAFFHARPQFTQGRDQGLDPQLQSLSVTLLPVDLATLSQVWATIGGRQLPAALFRVRVTPAPPAPAAPRGRLG